MRSDPEIVRWQQRWQSHEPIHVDVRRRLERGSRSMRCYRASEIAVAVVFGGGSIAWALLARNTAATVLAIAMSTFIVVGWTAAEKLRRGAWEAASGSTSAFVDLLIVRAQRDLKAVVVSAWLYALILTFDLIWLYGFRRESNLAVFLTRWPVLVVWVVTAFSAVWAMLARRRFRRQLEMLQQLRQQLGAS